MEARQRRNHKGKEKITQDKKKHNTLIYNIQHNRKCIVANIISKTRKTLNQLPNYIIKRK